MKTQFEILRARTTWAEAALRLAKEEERAFSDLIIHLSATDEEAFEILVSLDEAKIPKSRKNWFRGMEKRITSARENLARQGSFFLIHPSYNPSHTPSYNLAGNVRFGTDDQRGDLAFWLDKFFAL